MKDSDKRRHPRRKMHLSVFVSHPKSGQALMRTRDMSDGGLYVQGSLESLPDQGDVVEVRVNGLLGNGSPGVTMRVVRGDGDGLALRFL